MVAFLINISVISVTGAVCHSPSMSPDDQEKCEDLDLNKASFLLKVGDTTLQHLCYSITQSNAFSSIYNVLSLNDNVSF